MACDKKKAHMFGVRIQSSIFANAKVGFAHFISMIPN